jgi:hypothetical protein
MKEILLRMRTVIEKKRENIISVYIDLCSQCDNERKMKGGKSTQQTLSGSLAKGRRKRTDAVKEFDESVWLPSGAKSHKMHTRLKLSGKCLENKG